MNQLSIRLAAPRFLIPGRFSLTNTTLVRFAGNNCSTTRSNHTKRRYLTLWLNSRGTSCSCEANTLEKKMHNSVNRTKPSPPYSVVAEEQQSAHARGKAPHEEKSSNTHAIWSTQKVNAASAVSAFSLSPRRTCQRERSPLPPFHPLTRPALNAAWQPIQSTDHTLSERPARFPYRTNTKPPRSKKVGHECGLDITPLGTSLLI